MSAKKLFSVAAVLFCFLFTNSCGSGGGSTFVASLADRDRLVVAVPIDAPGYFRADGKNFGYQYDLLKAYADDLGLELKLVTGKTPAECRSMMRKGKADIVAGIASKGHDSLLVSLYKTSYVIAGNASSREEFLGSPSSVYRKLAGSRIMVCAGFKASPAYRTLLDSLRGNDIGLSYRPGVELLRSLADGGCDYVICEKSEYRFATSTVKGVSLLHDFRDNLDVAIVTNPRVDGLTEDFAGWLEEYTGTPEFTALNYLYFENENGAILTGIHGKRIHKISVYDDVIREVCRREGADWRLISAIAYHESRFNPNVVSRCGARGLMQIMPAIARQFNISDEEIVKPEVNVMVAIKLLQKIERSLKLPENTSYCDRMSIVLACYNCGVGHVADARRLAKKYGLDPHDWDDVASLLQRKAEPEYYNDEVVRCGQLRPSGSRQTLAFVRNVMGHYSAYCLAMKTRR